MLKIVATILWPMLVCYVCRAQMLNPQTDKPEDAWCYLARSTTVIGVPFQPDVTQITYDGALFTRHAELCFFYGAGNRPLLATGKTLSAGGIPVVQYAWKDGNIKYDIEYFAFPLEGSNADNSVNFVRITMHNTGARPAEGNITAALRFNGEDYRFGPSAEKFSPSWVYSMTASDVIRDNRIVYCFSPGAEKESVPGAVYQKGFTGADRFITPRAECCLTKYSRHLGPGKKYSVILKMPRVPVPISDTVFVSRLQRATYDVYRAKTMDYWQKLLSKATKIQVPEQRFQDAYNAGLLYVLLSTRTANGRKFQTDGLPYPEFFLTSVPEMTMLYLSSGLWNYPKDLLIPDAIAQQQPDGLFFDRSVAHGKIIPATQGHILYSIAMTAIYTQDTRFAAKVYPAIKRGVAFIKNSMDSDKYGLLPPCYAYDAEMISGHYTGQNLFALMGLRNSVRVARLLGQSADATSWTALADVYEKNILRAIAASAKPDGYIPPGLYPYLTGPNAIAGMAEYQTDCDWENMILAFPTEVLDPDDPRLKGTLSRIRQEFAEGIMTYRHGLFLHQYITANMVEQYLAMGDGFTALKDFYHQLLHSGSAQECFENLVRPWTNRMVDENCPPPHAWGSAKQALMVRDFLLMEYGGKCGLEPGKREIWLFNCLSPDWVLPGKKVSITDAPTEFGTMDASITFTDNGAKLSIKKRFHTDPADYRIRVPYFKELVSFTTDASVKNQVGDCIVLSPDATHINMVWRDRPGAHTGIMNKLLLGYRSENTFMGGDKDGNSIIKKGDPFLTDEEKSDSNRNEPLSFALVRKAFQYEYSRRAEAALKNGAALMEVKAPEMLTGDQRRQLFDKRYSKSSFKK